jgi:hypothetical protein
MTSTSHNDLQPKMCAASDDELDLLKAIRLCLQDAGVHHIRSRRCLANDYMWISHNNHNFECTVRGSIATIRREVGLVNSTTNYGEWAWTTQRIDLIEPDSLDRIVKAITAA